MQVGCKVEPERPAPPAQFASPALLRAVTAAAAAKSSKRLPLQPLQLQQQRALPPSAGPAAVIELDFVDIEAAGPSAARATPKPPASPPPRRQQPPLTFLAALLCANAVADAGAAALPLPLEARCDAVFWSVDGFVHTGGEDIDDGGAVAVGIDVRLADGTGEVAAMLPFDVLRAAFGAAAADAVAAGDPDGTADVIAALNAFRGLVTLRAEAPGVLLQVRALRPWASAADAVSTLATRIAAPDAMATLAVGYCMQVSAS
jgi:hypothetical protein